MPATWYGVAYEPANIEIVRRSQTIRNLPARLNGLTAVQISDLHLSQSTSVHVKMVELIQGSTPTWSWSQATSWTCSRASVT